MLLSPHAFRMKVSLLVFCEQVRCCFNHFAPVLPPSGGGDFYATWAQYYQDSVTLCLAALRPSCIPYEVNILGQLRDAVRILPFTHCEMFLPVSFGTVGEINGSVIQGTGFSRFSRRPRVCHRILAFKQFSFSHIGQPLRYLLGGFRPTSIRFTKMLCSGSGFPFP